MDMGFTKHASEKALFM